MAAPAAMRRPISPAIQSASSGPVAKASRRTGRSVRKAALRPQRLADAGPDLQAIRVVEADQPMARREDRREGAVVASQDDVADARVALRELEDVADRGAAERVDGLIVVADDRDVVVAFREQRHEFRLRPVRVLELVDEDVAEPVLDLLARGRRLAQQPQRKVDLVAEIDEPGRVQQLLVARVRAGQLLLAGREVSGHVRSGPIRLRGRVSGRGDRRLRRLGRDREPIRVREIVRRIDVLVLAAAEEPGERREEPRGIAERAVAVQFEVEQVFAQEDHGLRARQHAHVRGQPQFERELADDAIPEGMEGGDRAVRVAVRHELIDAQLHLVRGLVREREGENLRWLRAMRRDQPRDAAGDDLRLARPGAGDHEHRALAVRDGAPLFHVEPAEERIHAGRRGWRRLRSRPMCRSAQTGS